MGLLCIGGQLLKELEEAKEFSQSSRICPFIS